MRKRTRRNGGYGGGGWLKTVLDVLGAVIEALCPR